MPAVSVVVPVYNNSSTVERCLNSVFIQTLTDVELIVVNDGSVDDSRSIIDSLTTNRDNVKVVHQDNKGVSSARNAGLDFACGKYIFFLDADDWLEPDALEVAYNAAEKEQADIVTFDFWAEYQDRTVTRWLFPKPFVSNNFESIKQFRKSLFYIGPLNLVAPEFDSLFGMGGCAWHHLILRDLIKTNNVYFDDNVSYFEDGLFMFQATKNLRKIVYLHKPLYHAQRDAPSATQGYKPNICKDFDVLLPKLIEIVGSEPDDGFEVMASARAAMLVHKACGAYFCNDQNLLPQRERYRLFLNFVNSEPMKPLLKNLNPGLFLSKRDKLRAMLLKNRLFKVYWAILNRNNH